MSSQSQSWTRPAGQIVAPVPQGSSSQTSMVNAARLRRTPTHVSGDECSIVGRWAWLRGGGAKWTSFEPPIRNPLVRQGLLGLHSGGLVDCILAGARACRWESCEDAWAWCGVPVSGFNAHARVIPKAADVPRATARPLDRRAQARLRLSEIGRAWCCGQVVRPSTPIARMSIRVWWDGPAGRRAGTRPR